MAKKKTLMIRAVGKRRALLSYRKMIIRNALNTMYNTTDLNHLYNAEEILYRECQKAFKDNWFRTHEGR